jgi:hypothetical protein
MQVRRKKWLNRKEKGYKTPAHALESQPKSISLLSCQFPERYGLIRFLFERDFLDSLELTFRNINPVASDLRLALALLPAI